jgi:hypothetical protein
MHRFQRQLGGSADVLRRLYKVKLCCRLVRPAVHAVARCTSRRLVAAGLHGCREQVAAKRAQQHPVAGPWRCRPTSAVGRTRPAHCQRVPHSLPARPQPSRHGCRQRCRQHADQGFGLAGKTRALHADQCVQHQRAVVWRDGKSRHHLDNPFAGGRFAARAGIDSAQPLKTWAGLSPGCPFTCRGRHRPAAVRRPAPAPASRPAQSACLRRRSGLRAAQLRAP